MQHYSLMAKAATPTIAIIGNITTDQFHGPTPCTEFDVQKLINHLLFWGPPLEGAAGRKSVTPAASSEHGVNLTDGDWKGKLEAQTDSLVAAWSEPAAWQGTTALGGPVQMPAPMIGGMVLGELVVHGWDLARATGQDARWDDDVLTFALNGLENTAEQGRDMGVYGHRVPVPVSAPLLHQVLGLTGRDPNWTAAAAVPAQESLQR